MFDMATTAGIKRSSFGVVLVFSDKFTADKLIF